MKAVLDDSEAALAEDSEVHLRQREALDQAALAAVLEKHLKQKAVLVADLSSAPELKVQLSQQVEAILFSLMMMKMLRMKRHLSG